jgi:hypothetical protein
MKRPALLLAAFCSSAAVAGEAPAGAKHVSVTLEPGKVHEACMKLENGDRRRYEWKSSAGVDFNIHYHSGSDVAYPVKKDAARSWRAGFVAKSAQEYCWMWTALAKPAKIEGWIGK